MKISFLKRAAVGLAVGTLLPTAAMAQAWTPGSEIVGQPIQVTTNGTTNTLYLDPGGQARILTPNGNTVSGLWNIASGQLCLGVAGAQECVPYNSPFQPQQAQNLTSSCGSAQTWVAQATNQASQGQRGERGR